MVLGICDFGFVPFLYFHKWDKEFAGDDTKMGKISNVISKNRKCIAKCTFSQNGYTLSRCMGTVWDVFGEVPNPL